MARKGQHFQHYTKEFKMEAVHLYEEKFLEKCKEASVGLSSFKNVMSDRSIFRSSCKVNRRENCYQYNYHCC